MDRKINTDSIAEQVYDILKNEIISGLYKPGHQFIEMDVADRLNVSRSPVRFAIHQLVRDGLLVYYPNRGAFVKHYSSKEVHDSFEIRLLLESYSISHIDPELRQHFLPELERLLEILKTGKAEAKEDIDRQVHELPVKMTGNEVLLNQYSTLFSMIRAFRSISLASDEMIDMARISHVALLEAILNDNIPRALRVIKKHLEASESQVLAYYKKSDLS